MVLMMAGPVVAQDAVRVTPGVLKVGIPERELKSLSAESREVLRFVTDHLIQNIQTVESIEAEFPPSYFETQEPIINPGDYLVLPSGDQELIDLSGQRFSREQVAQIKEQGTFQIASLNYPNHPHVWQISAYLWNEIGIGIGGGTLIAVGMPSLVLANTAVSSVLAVAAATPALSTLAWATNATLYSFENRGRRSWGGRWYEHILPPITQVTFPVVMGSLRSGVALGLRLPWHALRGLGYGLKATVYDSIFLRIRDAFFSGLIKRFGETRSRDAFDMKRIQGPGLASEYYFQVNRELVLLSLRAYMEDLEVERIGSAARREINTPMDRVERVYGSVLKTLFGEAAFKNDSAVLGNLVATREEQLKGLSDELSEQRKFYASLLNQDHRGAVRLSDENLRYVLAAGAILAEQYLSARMKTWETDEIISFWKSRGL